ncbi:MAG TPA: diadenylate cyclase CdaA [Polyangiaceae bacterium]|nr:diadenylate cyclase CdaA [Polyangiaceae bacterium]
MMEELFGYVLQRALTELLRDAADLLITYYLIYRISLVLRGTRAVQIGLGLAFLLVLYGVSKYFQLGTLFAILGTVLPSAILIIVVVFQEDIRRGLMRMGSGAWLGTARYQEVRVIDEVIAAATELARHRIGAIIAFEQDANLDEFVGSHKGTEIDAAVSSQLLVSLFVPEAMNKLHDGAVIIRDLRIAKAGVFFPFTQGRVIDESFGSRHRAAMGITDETDAVLVVVSEERGSISFCFNGNIVSDLDGPRLRAALEGVFAPKTKGPKRPGAERFWSMMLPSQLLRRRARTGAVSVGAQTPSEVPPPSVRIRATVPSGITSPVPGDSSPLPTATKPLRKTASKGESGKSVSPPAASLPPRAPDESS